MLSSALFALALTASGTSAACASPEKTEKTEKIEKTKKAKEPKKAIKVAKAPKNTKMIQSSDAKVPVARVAKIINLVDKPHIQVNLVVEDLGGTTDVSPTRRVFFTLYAKGEMFSTDAAFDLGPHFGLVSAKRVSGGVYEVTFAKMIEPKAPVYRIDATDAIVAMKAVRCEDFDCPASKDFKAKIRFQRVR